MFHRFLPEEINRKPCLIISPIMPGLLSRSSGPGEALRPASQKSKLWSFDWTKNMHKTITDAKFGLGGSIFLEIRCHNFSPVKKGTESSNSDIYSPPENGFNLKKWVWMSELFFLISNWNPCQFQQFISRRIFFYFQNVLMSWWGKSSSNSPPPPPLVVQFFQICPNMSQW